MDNLAVHISNTIKERMDELGIAYVYSVIYSPQFNPIEEVFAMSKKIIKDRRLKAIMNNEEIDLYDVIKDSFNYVNVLKIKNCIQHAD